MKLSITSNFPDVQRALKQAASQVPFAMRTAINKTAVKAQKAIKAEMPKVFDRPTNWVLNSLRIKYAEKTKVLSELSAEIAYKDRNTAESSRSMIEPHVFSGKRSYKAMEVRLMRVGILPRGYNAVPGEAAKLDAFGNMNKGQITQVLNVLGTYTEAGYNKANEKTIKRLAKGSVKKNIAGFVYWVNPVGPSKAKHLQPGVYQRVKSPLGTVLKPVLIFVKQAQYRKRLDFFGIGKRVVNREFAGEFNSAFDAALKTARFNEQGSLL